MAKKIEFAGRQITTFSLSIVATIVVVLGVILFV